MLGGHHCGPLEYITPIIDNQKAKKNETSNGRCFVGGGNLEIGRLLKLWLLFFP